MKLIIAILTTSDSSALSKALTESGIGVTKLATTGGFLKQGNTTLLMGVADEKVDEVMSLIKKYSGKRTKMQPVHNVSAYPSVAPAAIETTVGGATVFITDIERFEKL